MRKFLAMTAVAVMMSAPAFAYPTLVGGSSASTTESTTGGNSFEEAGSFNIGKSVTSTGFSVNHQTGVVTDTTTTASNDFGNGWSFGNGGASTGEGGFVSSSVYGF